MMSFNFALTEEDYKNYYVYMVWQMPNKKKQVVMNSLKYLIPTIFFILLFNFLINKELFNSTIIIVVVYLTWIQAFSLLYMETTLKKQAHKIAYNPMNNAYFLTTNYTFLSDGFTVKTSLHKTSYKYSVIIKKLENNLYYYLFLSAEHALIIPKRVFNSSFESEEFEKILSKNLGDDINN